MLKILQAHLLVKVLRAFVANLKIDAIYALYPESFCDKNLAVRKVFAFSDSDSVGFRFERRGFITLPTYPLKQNDDVEMYYGPETSFVP